MPYIYDYNTRAKICQEKIEKLGYKLLGKYQGMYVKIKIRCPKGHILFVNPYSACKGRCKKCHYKDMTINSDEVIKMIQSKNMIPLSKNPQLRKLCLIKCKKCHKKFKILPQCMKQKKSWSCPHCRSTNFLYWLKNHRKDLKVVGEYNGSDNISIFKCSKGHIFKCRGNDIKNHGANCSVCYSQNTHINEDNTYKYLKKFFKKSDIVRKFQIVNPRKKPQKNVFVDFFIPKINLMIEYNGTQHYGPVKAWKGEEGYRKQRLRDLWLKRWCKKHFMRLLVIDGRKYKRDEILKFLKLKL